MGAVADLKAGRALRFDTAPVEFSHHAVERFAERFRPGLSLDEVRRQLPRTLLSARAQTELPDGYHVADQTHVSGYLVAEGACFPIVIRPDGCWLLTTCLARGSDADSYVGRRPKPADKKKRGRKKVLA